MSVLNFLYKKEYSINDKIKVMIPTVGEILDDEENYYNLVNILTAMPIDLMLPLYEAGIDFTTVDSYDIFLIMSKAIQQTDTHLIFGNLDLSKFQFTTNPQNGNPILIDRENEIIIDRAIHGKVAAALRKIHHIEKNNKRPANEEAKKYLIERAKIKARRNKNRAQESQLEPLIVAMVNTGEFKYNFEETLGLSIYQFGESVRQIIHKHDYEHRMFGIYSGSIDPKGINEEDLNWLIHK